MTLERLRAVHRAVPFVPFTLHMADGRSLPVRHPEFLSMSPTGRTVIVNFDNDDFCIVDLLLVTSIEVTPPAAASA